MSKKHKKGISLIVLVITIIVIIILAGAVILSLASNNPISQASKAIYLNDVKNFETELELYKGKQFVDNLGSYNPALLQADNDSVTYNGIVDTSKTMNDVIPSLLQSSKYSGQFQVIAGKLIYGGLDTTKQGWTVEAGLEVVIIGEPKITILSPSPILAERGTDIVYTIKFFSNLALTTVNLASKVEVLDNAGVALPVQPVISIGTVSGIATDTTRQVDITITTDNLVNGTYKLKIKPGVVTNSNNKSNTIDTISLVGFDMLDSIPPVNPTMVASPTIWTNGNVAVTISYSADSVTKEYSTNGTTWNSYTAPVVVSENATTVYASGKDIATNESGVATLTVGNIDKTVPIVTATDGGKTTSSVTVNATANDVGGSTLNDGSYQYSKDNGATWTTASSETSYTFSSLVSGAYQCKVKVADNASNSTISNVVAISTTGLGTITLGASPAGWTNGNVTVTITYPAEVVTKQYSTDGTTWNTYTAAVVVTANSTVYAKGLDAGGNQTLQATLTVANIDKTVPTVVATSGTVTTSSVTVNAAAADTGGSGLTTTSYQYSKDNGATWTTASSATSYVFSTLTTGTYQCKARVVDNAGNSTISNTIGITTTALGSVTLLANPTGWTNGNVTVTITYPAIIVTKQYSTNGTTWNTYTVPVVVSANSTVYAKGLDAGGNQATQATLTVANIDKTAPSAPTINLNGYSSGSWTRGDVTQTFSSSDVGSGIQKYQYTVDNGSTWSDAPNPWTINWDGQWTFYIRAIDNVGNISGQSSAYTIRRDATPPTITVNGNNPASIYVNDVYSDAGASATDNLSGILGSVGVSNNLNTSVPGTYTVTYTATDNAGNVTTRTRAVNVLQNTSFTFDFNSASDLNYFQIGSIGASGNSKVEVSSGYMIETSLVLDNSKSVRITPAAMAMSDFKYVEFKYKKVGSVTTAAFPYIDIYFADGNKLRYFLMTNFSWSGYGSIWWVNTIYLNSGFSIYEFGNENIYTDGIPNPVPIMGRVGSAAAHTNEAVYSVQLNKSTGTMNIYNGYNGTTITTPVLTTSKVVYIDFNLQCDWYNSYNQSYIDYIKVTN